MPYLIVGSQGLMTLYFCCAIQYPEENQFADHLISSFKLMQARQTSLTGNGIEIQNAIMLAKKEHPQGTMKLNFCFSIWNLERNQLKIPTTQF